MRESYNLLKGFEIKDIISNDLRKFTCWGSVEVVDRQGEVIPIEEIEKTMDVWMSRGGPINVNHTNQTVGKALNWRREDKNGNPGILITAELFKHYKTDDQVWDMVKNSEIEGLSIGGRAYTKEESGGTTFVKDLITWEFSLVPRTGNQEATFESINMMAKSNVEKVNSTDAISTASLGEESIKSEKDKSEVNKMSEEELKKQETSAPEEKTPEGKEQEEQDVQKSKETNEVKKQEEEQIVEEEQTPEKDNNEILGELAAKIDSLGDRMSEIEKIVSGKPEEEEEPVDKVEKEKDCEKQEEEESEEPKPAEEEEEVKKSEEPKEPEKVAALEKENAELKKSLEEMKEKTPKELIKTDRPAESEKAPEAVNKRKELMGKYFRNEISGIEYEKEIKKLE